MNTELAEFLAADSRPEGTMILPQLYGFLFAVCCSPEPVEPSDWLPFVFNDGDPAFKDDAETAAITAAVIEAYNEVNDGVESGSSALPAWCQLDEPPMENFGAEHPVSHWAEGYGIGHDWLHEVWDAYVDNEDDELGACMMTLSFFSSIELAEAYCVEFSTREPISIENLAETVADNFANAMLSYADISVNSRKALRDTPREPFAREEAKVGRNDECPCGSGKKYKKCCMDK
ncbi:UPF0149 family protein [Pseudomonadota bacterium]